METATTAVDISEAAPPSSPSKPLGVLFRLAQAAYIATTDTELPVNDESVQKRVLEGLNVAEGALLQVERQSIFSSNELADDINTGDLKYLLLPFYRGEMLLRAGDQRDSTKRMASLREALKTLRGFAGDLERLELLPEEAKNWQQVALVGSAAADPATVREQKIARFKAGKAAKARLEIVQNKLKAKNGDADDEEEEDGDELEREQAKLMLQTALHQALDSIRTGEMEADMLKQIEGMRKPDGSLPPTPTVEEEDPRFGLQMLSLVQNADGGGGGSGRVGGAQSLLSGPLGLKTVDPIRDPSSRLSYATAMQQIHTGQIPGLYTYTVEEGMRMEEAERALGEAAHMEAMGQRAEARQLAKEERQLGNDEEDEEERLKLIKQDEFRENVKRGSGNRANRS